MRAYALKGALRILWGFLCSLADILGCISSHSAAPFLTFQQFDVRSSHFWLCILHLLLCSYPLLFTRLMFTLYSPESASLFLVPPSPLSSFFVSAARQSSSRSMVWERNSLTTVLFCYPSLTVLQLDGTRINRHQRRVRPTRVLEQTVLRHQ